MHSYSNGRAHYSDSYLPHTSMSASGAMVKLETTQSNIQTAQRGLPLAKAEHAMHRVSMY